MSDDISYRDFMKILERERQKATSSLEKRLAEAEAELKSEREKREAVEKERDEIVRWKAVILYQHQQQLAAETARRVRADELLKRVLAIETEHYSSNMTKDVIAATKLYFAEKEKTT